MTHLRADAQENRERILSEARALFAGRGLDVGMREIARRAGLGPATLYRHFPTKQLLVEQAFALELAACRRVVVDGCADPDPWRGFAAVIHGLTALNARNKGFVDAFTTDEPANGAFAGHRTELLGMLARLARRAQQHGELRPDFAIADLVLVLQAGRGLSFAQPEARAAAAQRFATLALDAFRTRPRD